MAGHSRFSDEQMEKIRATLAQSLGEESGQVVKSIEKRFGGAGQHGEGGGLPDADEHDDEAVASASVRLGTVNVARIVQEGKVEKMLEAIPAVLTDPKAVRILVANVIKLGKAFQMVEALSKVKNDKELVDALVHAIISKKGLNPLIDSLRHAGESPQAMKKLALAIADQGTVNHIIRAIATVSNNPEAEMIWAMEVMGKGSVEQMLEALNLIGKDSPGAVILATGVVSSKDSGLEQMVRAMAACRDNPKASSILAVELAKRADTTALVSVLEKYVSDDTEAGEIVVARLVQKGRPIQMVEACKHISGNSQSGRILAAGLVKRADSDQLMRAYKLLSSSPSAKKIVALEIVKKKGKLMALRALGSEVWDLVKNQEEIESFAIKAHKRYLWILKNELGEEIHPPAAGAKPKTSP